MIYAHVTVLSTRLFHSNSLSPYVALISNGYSSNYIPRLTRYCSLLLGINTQQQVASTT